MKRRVSVLITAHNAASTIGVTLRAISKQRLPDDVSMQVVVVDDRSTDDTSLVAHEAGASAGLCLTLERMAAHSSLEFTARQAALDAGIARTDAPFVLLLDADATPSPTWVGTMLTFLARFDVVSSPIRFAPRSATLSQRWLAALQSADAAYYAAVARGVAACGSATGVCFGGAGIRRTAIERVGSFRALGFSLAEDLTFARAAHARGLSVGFVREAFVTVECAPSWRTLRTRALRVSAVGGASVLAMALALPVATLPLLALLAFVGVLPWWVVGARWALGGSALLWAMGANGSRRSWPAAISYEWCALVAAMVVTIDAHRHRRIMWGGIEYARDLGDSAPSIGVGR